MKALRVFAVACALAVGGCASAPKASNYLDDYTALVPGTHLERVRFSPSLDRSSPLPVSLGEIEPQRVVDMESVSVETAVQWLRDGLAAAGITEGTARYRLDLAISEMNPGSAAARIFAGEFGAGHAWVQVEGRLVDTQDGAIVGEFAERRRASGAAGLKDLGGDAGPAMVEEIMKSIAADIAKELNASS